MRAHAPYGTWQWTTIPRPPGDSDSWSPVPPHGELGCRRLRNPRPVFLTQFAMNTDLKTVRRVHTINKADLNSRMGKGRKTNDEEKVLVPEAIASEKTMRLDWLREEL